MNINIKRLTSREIPGHIWANRVAEAIEWLGKIKGGSGVRVSMGADGPTISVPPQAASGPSSNAALAIPCVTTDAPTDGVYPVNLHADGKNEPSTGTGEIELLSVHIGEELPTGTWILGFEATVIVTGGS
jgi:hypothetical protein